MFVIVVGGGRTGSQLTSMLQSQGHDVRLIENRPNLLPRLHREHPTEVIVEGDPSDPSVLEAAGLKDAQVLAACHSDDTINLVVSFIAREIFQTPRTIARVNNPRNAWLFNETFHVDSALNASNVFASLIQEEMSLGDMVTLLKLRRGRYSLVEEKVPQNASSINIAIKDLELPSSCVIAAIIRKGEVCLPTGNTTFQPGDEVLAITDKEGAQQLERLFSPK